MLVFRSPRRPIATTLMSLLVLGAIGSPARASSGGFDSSFGNGGISVAVAGHGTGERVTLQGDGKIVAISYHGSVVRFTAAGQLDASFGQNGVARTPVSTIEEQWDGNVTYSHQPQVTTQVDDGVEKIVVAGGRVEPLSLSRLMPDGSLDRSFGADGVVREPGVTGLHADLTSLASGKLLQAATLAPAASVERTCLFSSCAPRPRPVGVVIVRTPDGVPDPSFGTGGYAFIRPPVASTEIAQITDVAVQPDGKIVVLGEIGYRHSASPFVARLLPTGQPDPLFAGGGTTLLQRDLLRRGAVGVRSDGTIILAGMAGCATVYTIYDAHIVGCKVRLATMSAGGTIQHTVDGPEQPVMYDYSWPTVRSVLVDDQRAFAATAQNLTAFTRDGALDTSFGTDGVFDLTDSYWLGAATRQPDGKIVTTGNNYGLVVARHTLEGGSSAPPVVQTGSIGGWVYDQSSKERIVGALVDCGDGYRATTDQNGQFQIWNVPLGGRNCTASASGYQSKKQHVEVTEYTTWIEFFLRKGK